MIQFPPTAQYLLESSICLFVFYIMYKMFFQKNTFFQINRIYLLSGALLSFFIPLLHIQSYPQETAVISSAINTAQYLTIEFNTQMDKGGVFLTFSCKEIIISIYVLGVTFFSTRLFFKLNKIKRIIQQSEKTEKGGLKTLHTNEQDTSSFFNWIFFNSRHDKNNSDLILQHELVHVRQWHSLDVIIMEILCIFNWFNPIIYLYQKCLRENHEFIADDIVSSIAPSKYEYAKLLIEELQFHQKPILSNSFSSMIKKRLVMISEKNKNKKNGFIYFSIIPIIFLLISFFSTQNIAPSILPNHPKENIIPDIMPTYGNCLDLQNEERKKCSDSNIIQFISSHVKYPEDARKKGIEGMAVIRFIVKKDGSLYFDPNVEKTILRDPGSGCGEEALRVVQSFEQWHPGVVNGKRTDIQFTLPIRFKLSD